jgi:isopentenyl diphosphate isomerase/L-lactate dehydrogenase-like FMN-dependent dehydrogenase
VTLSILSRAKASGFTALVVTVDTFKVSFRPHDLDTAYLPFVAGVGLQVGTSDPVFMRERMGGALVLPDERPAFPLDFDAFRAGLAEGSEQARTALERGVGWVQEVSVWRTWEDLKFLRDNWDGPILLKGIQAVEDAHAAMDAQMDGIIVSNHGTFLARA